MDGDLVYVVHPDPELAAHLSRALIADDCKVVRMTTEAEAAASGKQYVLPDAILTPLGDLESADSILIQLFRSNPLMEQIPVVVLAGDGPGERRRALRLGLLSVIFPPYDHEEIVLTTQLAIEKHRTEQLLFGSLAQLSVPDLLQTAQTGRRTGTIEIQHGGRKGTLWLRDGVVINAAIDDASDPEEAVYEIVLWETGTFEANFHPIDVDERFSLRPSELLLEAMRRLDEGQVTLAAEIAMPVVESSRQAKEATLHLALTLLNVAVSYAANQIELSLVAARCEEVRRQVMTRHPAAEAFRVASGGLVALADGSLRGEARAFAAAAGRWMLALFERLDSALAWHFSPARLAQITRPWHEDMRALGFPDPAKLRSDDGQPELAAAAVGGEEPMPLGCFILDASGVIARYSPFGPRTDGIDPRTILGRPLPEVLPPQISEEVKKLLASLGGDNDKGRARASTFSGRGLPESIRCGLVRSPDAEQTVFTCNRVPGPGRTFSAELKRDEEKGTLVDGNMRVISATNDFLLAFEGIFVRSLSHRRYELLHQFGKGWGMRHVLRVDQLAQRQYGMTLRELESHVAMELFSASVGVLGLGRFDVSLSYRDSGLMVISHHNSPFVDSGAIGSGGSCAVLAGFHAALFSYLSGRQLAAREISCSQSPDRLCWFIVATQERLTSLLIAAPGTRDHTLLERIVADSLTAVSR